MFFNKDSDKQQQAAPQRGSNPAIINQFYFGGANYEQMILNIANGMMKNSVIISFSDGNIFPVSHLADALIFLNTTIQEVCQGGLSMNKKQWVAGKLPSGVNPKIEIGADKIVDYLAEALDKYPTKEFEEHRATLKEFQTKFNSPEIQSALGIVSSSFNRS